MDPLDALVADLEALPWSRRCQLKCNREKNAVSLSRGTMHAHVRLVREGGLEVAYDSALHETTRVRLPPGDVQEFLLKVLWRDQLHPVEKPASGEGTWTPECGNVAER